MGAARCRGTYADRKGFAMLRGPIARHQTPALPAPTILGQNVIVARKSAPDAQGNRETTFVRERTKQKRQTSADGRAQYEYDGKQLRRL